MANVETVSVVKEYRVTLSQQEVNGLMHLIGNGSTNKTLDALGLRPLFNELLAQEYDFSQFPAFSDHAEISNSKPPR